MCLLRTVLLTEQVALPRQNICVRTRQFVFFLHRLFEDALIKFCHITSRHFRFWKLLSITNNMATARIIAIILSVVSVTIDRVRIGNWIY
jgi:hypothetical protein